MNFRWNLCGLTCLLAIPFTTLGGIAQESATLESSSPVAAPALAVPEQPAQADSDNSENGTESGVKTVEERALLSPSAYRMLQYFYEYDPKVPLEPRVVELIDGEQSVRRKVIFRGARGCLVPAYLELPKPHHPPHPIILLMHGWSGSKNDWWKRDNYIYGSQMREALLAAGFAVFALDAQGHGDRIAENDYQVVNLHHEPGEPHRENYFSLRDIIVQTALDARRGIDYLQSRPDVDAKRIGVVGYSMGGFHAFALSAMEPRIKGAVCCVVPVAWRPDAILDPASYTRGFGNTSCLMLMGKTDELCNAEQARELYRLIESPRTEMQLFDAGHRLPPTYIPPAVAWLQSHVWHEGPKVEGSQPDPTPDR